MNFRIEETYRSYNDPSRGAVVALVMDVEHVFLAALRQLLEDYAGGGVFHPVEGRKLLLHPMVKVIRNQQKRMSPSPLDVLDPQQIEETQRSGWGVVGFALSGPPPGWRPPFTEEYRELVARHRRMALERGDSYTTVYEVLADVLTYPQVKRLLETVGQSAEEIAERVRPYLDRKVAEEEVGPNVRRWRMVTAGLHSGGEHLEPWPTQATHVFRISMATSVPMRLAMDTLTLGHLFLAGIKQVLTAGRNSGELAQDPLLGPLIPTIENDLTGGKPLPPNAVAIDSTGQRVNQGKVPMSMLKVPPEVERFLYRHREVAAQRGGAVRHLPWSLAGPPDIPGDTGAPWQAGLQR